MAVQAGQSAASGGHAAMGDDVLMTSPSASAGVTFNLPADKATPAAADASSNEYESGARSTLFSALQEIKLSLEDLLAPRIVDTPSSEGQSLVSIAPYLHPFDAKTASLLGFGDRSSDGASYAPGSSHGSGSTSSGAVAPPLTREHLGRALADIRTSLDKHRARILPALIRSSSDSSPGSAAPNAGHQQQQQAIAMTPDPSTNHTTTGSGIPLKDPPFLLHGQQPLKERYMMLLREQSADVAIRNILTAALRDPSLSNRGLAHFQTQRRRRLPKELHVEAQYRDAGKTSKKRKIAMVEDPADGSRGVVVDGASSSMTFPRSAMKGKSRAFDPPAVEGRSIDVLNGGAGDDRGKGSYAINGHNALSQFRQLSKQLEELPGEHRSDPSTPTSGAIALPLNEARVLLLQLSAALSSLAASWGLEHLEEKLDVHPSAQTKEGDKVHSHTLTIAGNVLVLDFDFWLLAADARSWSSSIHVRVSYATFDATTADQQANGSGSGGDEQHGLENLLEISVQSLSEAWLKAASGSGVDVQEHLEERYFSLEDVVSTLVELDRMSSPPSGNPGDGAASHGRDAFAELASTSKSLQTVLQDNQEKLGDVAVSLHSPLPCLNVALNGISGRLRLRQSGGYMIQLQPPLIATQATVHALQKVLAGSDDIPAQKIGPRYSQGTLPFLRYMTERAASAATHSPRIDQKELRIFPSFHSSCSHPGAILASIDAVPFQTLEKVPDLLCVLQKQLHVNELVRTLGDIAGQPITEQQTEPSAEDLEAQLQALIEGTDEMRTYRVGVSMLEEPELGIKLSFQVFFRPHLAGRVTCNLEATASRKPKVKAHFLEDLEEEFEPVELSEGKATSMSEMDPVALVRALLQWVQSLA